MTLEEICNKYGGTTRSLNRGTGVYNIGGDASSHGYVSIYDELFNSLRNDSINLLEIGVFQGRGLAMWSDYFPMGNIYGTDISIVEFELMEGPLQSKYNAFSNGNLKNIFAGDSTNLSSYDNTIIQDLPMFDIIIDDGLHKPKPNFDTLNNFWDKLVSGGYYVIEDIQHKHLPELLNLLDGSDIPKESTIVQYSHPQIKLTEHSLIIIQKNE